MNISSWYWDDRGPAGRVLPLVEWADSSTVYEETIPGKGDTLSGSRVSDGGLVVLTPPGTPKSGEFRKNGTIRRF